MGTGTRRLLVVAAAALVVGVPAASSFTIGLGATLLGGVMEPHGSSSAIHEAITGEAVRAGYPAASRTLVLDLQRGAENADITHQFDAETHFDNSSMGLDGGRTVAGRTPNFAGAFATAHARFDRAVALARGNPQVLAPTFESFGDLVASVRTTFAKLAVLPTCVAARACPTTFLAAQAARLTGWGAALLVNPDPDPHQPTGENSIFQQRCGPHAPSMCGLLGGVNSFYTTMFPALKADLDAVIPKVRAVYGDADPDVAALVRDRQALDAYLAFQELGHAFHSTEDFFAHSDYVELMAGVAPGTPIPSSVKAGSIAVPSAWADFSTAGVSKLLGAKAASLESGAVGAIWLDEGDYCRSAADFFFNPVYFTKLKYPTVQLLPWPKIAWKPFPQLDFGGRNPNPPAGFHYCHYPTATTVGLNKDEPKAEPDAARSSHPNFAHARAAAVDMASVLWCDFLKAVGGEACGAGGGAPAGNGGSGGAFGQPVAISAKGATGRYPAAGVDAGGTATVVWTSIAGAVHDLRVATHPAGGAWSAPVAIPGSAAFGPEDAVISVSPNGNAVVVAQDARVVAALRRGGSGAAFGMMAALTPHGDGDSYHAAMSDSGRAVVVWRTDAAQVRYAVAEPGQGFGAPVSLAGNAADPAVGIDASGNAVLAWKTGAEDPEAAISYALLPAGAPRAGAPRSLGQAAGAHGVDTETAIDVAPDGRVALAWDYKDDCDDCAWIFALNGALGTTTGGLGGAFEVSNPKDEADGGKVYAYAVTAGTGAGGTAGFAWSEAIDGGDRIAFRGVSGGGSLGGYQHVTANPATLLAAAMGNRLLLAWAEQTDTGERVAVASSAGGGPLRVELRRGYGQLGGIALGANRGGAAVAAWNTLDAGTDRVFAATAG